MSLSLKDKRIFIVEDNRNNLAIMTTILEQQGATIHFERWGRDTVAQIMEHLPIDIILMDLMLPYNITGYEIFDEIQSVLELADIPIVIVSATDPEIEIRKAREKGFAGFISKPIRFDRFHRQIISILNGEDGWFRD